MGGRRGVDSGREYFSWILDVKGVVDADLWSFF